MLSWCVYRTVSFTRFLDTQRSGFFIHLDIFSPGFMSGTSKKLIHDFFYVLYCCIGWEYIVAFIQIVEINVNFKIIIIVIAIYFRKYRKH
jgi:hypothetical protein